MEYRVQNNTSNLDVKKNYTKMPPDKDKSYCICKIKYILQIEFVNLISLSRILFRRTLSACCIIISINFKIRKTYTRQNHDVR